MMKRIALVLVVVAVLITAVGYLGGSWYFSDQIIARPITPLVESRSEFSGPAGYGLPAPEEIEVASDDEITLRGWYFDNDRNGDCAAVLLHGHSGNRYGALQYTPLFWERGCDLVLYDARGHGDSSPAFHTFGYHEKQDLVNMVNWVETRTGLAEEDVALVGVSYGAATALQAAPLLPDVAFIVADSSYQDVQTIVTQQGQAQFGDWVGWFVPGAFMVSGWRAGFDSTAASPLTAVGQVQTTDTPIMLTHSLQDEYTVSAHSEAIFANSNPETTVLHLNNWGAPHGRDIINEPEQYAALVNDFIAEYAPDFGLQE
ncbi:MAG: alpha/beta fold hydrolase [Anaerolineales bacterium]|nr:alpha/beta fold hydrolase [Anaerolineales bacterium]